MEGTIFMALVLYLFPLARMYQAVASQVQRLEPLQTRLFDLIYRGIWWVIGLYATAFKSLFSVIGILLSYIHDKWVDHVIPVYNALPAAIRVILDPGKYLLVGLWNLFMQTLGGIMVEVGQFMLSFGVWLRHYIRACWRTTESIARWASGRLIRIWTRLGNLGPYICEVWLTIANWLMRTGLQLATGGA